MSDKNSRMQVSVRDLPEVMFTIRRELVNVLRADAGSEANPEVAKRLREIAAEFEAGTSQQDARWARLQEATRKRPQGRRKQRDA